MKKSKAKSKTQKPKGMLTEVCGMDHGQIARIPIADVETNPWNPNTLTAGQFDMLVDNINRVGNIQPIVVVPIREEANTLFGVKWRIIDGEHRYEAERMRDSEFISAVVVDPEKVDETEQKIQTVRMNKIRGTLDVKKFAELVASVADETDSDLEDLGIEFGFDESEEFMALVDSTRETLPSAEAKREFDKRRDEIKDADDLQEVLSDLLARFGDTLTANYMIFDYGGKDHLWIRVRDADTFRDIKGAAQDVLVTGYTFDSFLQAKLTETPAEDEVSRLEDRLVPIETEDDELEELI